MCTTFSADSRRFSTTHVASRETRDCPMSGTLFFERRAARRFTVPLRLEVWSHDQVRPDVPRLEIRDFSRRGFYFYSELKRDLASNVDFAVLFRKIPSEREIDLVRGTAQIV